MLDRLIWHFVIPCCNCYIFDLDVIGVYKLEANQDVCVVDDGKASREYST